MKIFRSPIWKALGLTVALSLALTLFLYTAAPLAEAPIGQAILFLGVALLQVAAACLYGGIPFDKRRSLWLSLAAVLATHLILSMVSVFLCADRLAGNWPGSNYFLTWLLFFLLALSVWWISVCTVTLFRHFRMGAARRDELRKIEYASRGLRAETTPTTPARTRLVSTLWGLAWILGFYILTGLLLELLTAMSVADTILSYVAFPCLWCIMAAAYRYLRVCHTAVLTVTVSIANPVLLAAIMLFLFPSNVTLHVGYALLYLDSVLTAPFEHPEQLLLLAEFLSIWVILPLCGRRHRATPAG